MRKSLLFVVLLALLVAACRSGGPAPLETATIQSTSVPSPTTPPSLTPLPPSETPTKTLVPTATPTETPLPPQNYGPTGFPGDVNPLTGTRPDDITLLDRRPVAVKIQTFPRAQRPDWAVSLADIVYDYYQNNGLTRLTAVFYSKDSEQVGPVRSARLFDDHLVRMYEANFAFGGGDQRILNRLYNSEYADRLVVEGSSSCPALCRVDPNGFNFLVANSEEVGPYLEAKGVDNSRQNLDGMAFTEEAPSGGQSGQNAYVRYSISSYVNWKYDPDSGKYLRFQDKQEAYTAQEEVYEPFVDRIDNQQVSADNVVILKVIHEYTYKSGNSEIVDILLGGSGEAYAFRDGKVYQLMWNRSTDGIFSLTSPDGTPYTYKPGTTWYQVVGQSSTNELTQDAGLRFEFRIP